MRTVLVLLVLLVLVLVAGCGTSQSGSGEGDTAGQRFPDVLEAELAPEDGGGYRLDVTISSPYDSPERYADGWRVLTPQGDVIGEMTLSHDHATEQPFTRTQTGLEIPEGVDTVTVEGRDTENGYGGETVEVAVPEA